MDHDKRLVAENDLHDLALERCDCGRFALSLGPVTVQLEADALVALTDMLSACLRSAGHASARANVPGPRCPQ